MKKHISKFLILSFLVIPVVMPSHVIGAEYNSSSTQGPRCPRQKLPTIYSSPSNTVYKSMGNYEAQDKYCSKVRTSVFNTCSRKIASDCASGERNRRTSACHEEAEKEYQACING